MNEEFEKRGIDEEEEVNDVKFKNQMRNNKLIDNNMVRSCDVKMGDRKQRSS